MVLLYLFLETVIFKGTLKKLFSYALEGLLELIQYLHQLFFTKQIKIRLKLKGNRGIHYIVLNLSACMYILKVCRVWCVIKYIEK